MKMVFTDSAVYPCYVLRSLLEARGIPSLIKNEYGSAVVGLPIAGAVAFAWPQVWVHEDHVDEAAALVAELKQQEHETLEPWQCPKCREVVDGELDCCWNCETDRPA